MIELGQDIFGELHKPYNRNRHELTPDKLAASLIASLAEVKLLEKKDSGISLVDVIAPFISAQDAASEIANNPELQEQVAAAQSALAEQFSTPDRLLLPENFGVVTTDDAGSKKFYTVLTDPTGLYRGSWNAIKAGDEETNDAFTIELNGRRIDTRQAMTRRVHRAMNTQALAAYLAGPLDVIPLGSDRNDHATGTWYTGVTPRDDLGRPRTDSLAPFSYDAAHYPDMLWRDKSVDSVSLGFRPGLLVATQSLVYAV